MAKRKRKTTPSKAKEAASASAAADLLSASTEPLFARRDLLFPLIAFVALLVLYVATLAPSVVGGDSGELLASALSGGVPHPPGYPLFALLARLFGALPLGPSPAWRVNLLSAVSTAAAGGLVCAVVLLWTRRAAAALVAAALFGTSSEVWLHATSVEVFGLNVMFVALAFLLWLGVERTRRRGLVLCLAFASGLAMCNHHTFLFVGAPLCLRSFWVTRRQLGVRGTALAVVLGLLGLSPYAYLWFASASSAAVSWGDLGTLNDFFGHILRRAYGTFSMGHASKGSAFVDQGTFFPTLGHMAGLATVRLLWVGMPLALYGFYMAFRDKSERRLAWVLGLVLGFYVTSFSALSNLSTSQALYLSVLARFFIQSDCMLAIASGLGFAKLARLLEERWPAGRGWVGYVGAGLAFVAGVVFHLDHASQRNNTVFPDFVRAAFASLPRDAIVITMGDHLTGSIFYYHEIEKLRPDVIHLDRELLGTPWYPQRKRRLHPELFLPPGAYGPRGYPIKQLLDGNAPRPVVVIDRLETWDQSWKDGYKLVTNGLVHPLVPSAEFPSFEEWVRRDRRAMGSYDVMPALTSRQGSWEEALGHLVLAAQGGRAHLALVYSHDQGNDPGPARYGVALLEDLLAKAGGEQRLAVASKPGVHKMEPSANVWKDLGIGYEILSKIDASYLPKVLIAYEKFVERAPANDADLPVARKYVDAHHPKR
jgi:hypothetical protein